MKSVFQTAAFAGFPNVSFMVNNLPKTRRTSIVGAEGAMPDELKRKGPRGLAAIAQIGTIGRRGAGRWTAQAGFVAGGAVVGGLVAHKFVSEHELNAGRAGPAREAARGRRRRSGAEWLPLRDNLEGDVLRSAATPASDYAGDDVQPEARSLAFRSQPGLYLRMRVADATRRRERAQGRRRRQAGTRSRRACCASRTSAARAARSTAAPSRSSRGTSGRRTRRRAS